MDDDDYRIRFRARELWEQSGEPNGTFLEFWFAAEAELKSQRDEACSDFMTTSPVIEGKLALAPIVRASGAAGPLRK